MPIAGPFYCHSRYFCTVPISIDGKYIIAGTGDDAVQVWDIGLKKMVSEPFQGHKNLHSFTCSFLHKAHAPPCVLVISQFESDIKTGKTITGPSCRHSLYFRHMVNSVSFSHDDKHILSCSSDGTIRIWDSKAGKSVQDSFQGHTAGIQCVTLSNDST